MIVRWLAQALVDRERQIRHIFTQNPKAAIALDDIIRHQAKMLVDHPEAGRAGRLEGTRELVIPRTAFLLIYRLDRHARRVEILRLLHGAQQWPPKP
ncbi:type II toxin-antitoxin system mRNA interferase toxin, RelE/StbE family [Rhizobium sp. J15]|uniref:type II toxin-antitoxin system RelE/ParE family toxin n=1 Tax=Rhizobium sp. J15 TaxID=2035450 RepID=UPI000BEA2331|nr:type II toxin-antitoxin system RelE/ParE family toxin [Rhizobium sp. J15]PDT18763.1 type II toxin-antitoxin system mRNA interferase toxin, RelE/StbE family [Rhizobium sp. J15]